MTSPLCSFTYGVYHDINRVPTLINSEITTIYEMLVVDKLFLNANKTKFMIFTTTKTSWMIVKIAYKICSTLGVMGCLKRYLPLSALKIMYDSLIWSHIQFGITCWGFEWGRLAELQKRTVRIITNSKYNAHTEPLFKDLHLLKITDIFDVQCMNKFSNNTLPNYFRSMFQ